MRAARRLRRLIRALPGLTARDAYRRHFLGGRYLILVSHRRSGSSLLSHILQSHPDIAGVGETHRQYRTPLDLVGLAAEIQRLRGLPELPAWVLEKALEDFQVAPWVLCHPQVRVILLVRAPRPTVASMLDHMPELFGGADALPEAREHEAFAHLHSRYAGIASAAHVLGTRAFAVDHAELVGEPEATLGRLRAWLGLEPPLNQRYEIDAFTEEYGRGDPSPAIRKGYLDPAQPPPTRSLDPYLLRVAEERYVATRGALGLSSIDRRGR